MPARRGSSVRRPSERGWWRTESRRLYISLEVSLRAEEPEPVITLHVWLSSRFGYCCRATRLFCRYATSISSYRALPALSSEPAVPLLIRHCVPPAHLFPFRRLRRLLRSFPRRRCDQSAIQLSHRPPRGRAGPSGATPNPHSQHAGPPPGMPVSAPCVPTGRPFDAPRALRAPGNHAFLQAFPESSPAPAPIAVLPSRLPDCPEFSCVARRWSLRRPLP